MSDALEEGYERLLPTGPEWGEAVLTNHGPMAVEVLARHGYDDVIDPWLSGYLPKLTKLPPASWRISTDWREALGRGDRLGDWAAYFGDQARELPWRDVMAIWWPRLLPGIAAGTTHGVIRVAHAVRQLNRADSPGAVNELAQALAFWAARFRQVPGAAAPRGSAPPCEAFDALPRLRRQEGAVADRLGRLGQDSSWEAAQERLRAPRSPEDVPQLLQEVVHAATIRYAAHGHTNPVLLVHPATAPNAVLHCLPALPQALWKPSLEAVWSASAAITACYTPVSPPPPALRARHVTVTPR